MPVLFQDLLEMIGPTVTLCGVLVWLGRNR